MTVGGSAVVSTPTAPSHAASVTATLANYLIFGMRDVFAGRYFTEVEVSHNAPVVVLSYKLAIELVAERQRGSDARPRGARPRARVHDGRRHAGVSRREHLPDVHSAPCRRDGARARRQLTPTIIVRAPSMESVDATKAGVIDWLAMRYRDWERQVDGDDVARPSRADCASAMLMFKIVFGAFASIALIVGGVGIMNVLLASVTERTREIGVRKALGARRRDILHQFLAESVAMASVGTGLGTVIGFAAAFWVAALVRWQVPGAQLHAAITPTHDHESVISAVSIGLAFGTFPALRASRLSPIDAIRHE